MQVRPLGSTQMPAPNSLRHLVRTILIGKKLLGHRRGSDFYPLLVTKINDANPQVDIRPDYRIFSLPNWG